MAQTLNLSKFKDACEDIRETLTNIDAPYNAGAKAWLERHGVRHFYKSFISDDIHDEIEAEAIVTGPRSRDSIIAELSTAALRAGMRGASRVRFEFLADLAVRAGERTEIIGDGHLTSAKAEMFIDDYLRELSDRK